MNFLLIVYCHLLPAILPTQCVRDLRLDFYFFFKFFFSSPPSLLSREYPSLQFLVHHVRILILFPFIFFFFHLSYFFSYLLGRNSLNLLAFLLG